MGHPSGSTALLTPSQLKGLEKHKYSVECQSLLDPIMQKWWVTVVGWLPMWIAPNFITVTGLFINVLTSAILMYYCPTATEPAPCLVTLWCAIGLFIYQTLDAIDGKQARRTNSSSPLGELFDHGCDSLSTVFVVTASACATSLGHSPSLLMLQCFTASFLFYVAHWQTYVTGTMRFGKFDVTEGQLCVIAVMLCTSIFGSEFWDISLGLFELRIVPTLFASMVGLVSFVTTMDSISQGGAGKNGSTVAGTSVITPVIPILLALIPATVLGCYSEEGVFTENPIIFVLTFGMVASKITNKLIVAHMCRSVMAYEDITMLIPFCFFVKWYFGIRIISEKHLLFLSFIFAVVDLVMYSSTVCTEICQHLKVYMFKLK